MGFNFKSYKNGQEGLWPTVCLNFDLTSWASKTKNVFEKMSQKDAVKEKMLGRWSKTQNGNQSWIHPLIILPSLTHKSTNNSSQHSTNSTFDHIHKSSQIMYVFSKTRKLILANATAPLQSFTDNDITTTPHSDIPIWTSTGLSLQLQTSKYIHDLNNSIY